MAVAFWIHKTTLDRLLKYLGEKGLSYENKDDKITFELCFKNKGFILYPYVTVVGDIVSFNINVSKVNLKSYDFSILNDFNLKSAFFKAYLLPEGIVVLEYRFVAGDSLAPVLDEVLASLMVLEETLASI